MTKRGRPKKEVSERAPALNWRPGADATQLIEHLKEHLGLNTSDVLRLALRTLARKEGLLKKE